MASSTSSTPNRLTSNSTSTEHGEEMIDFNVFQDMYHRLNVEVMYFKLTNIKDFPACFTHFDKFNFDAADEYRFGMTHFLKRVKLLEDDGGKKKFRPKASGNLQSSSSVDPNSVEFKRALRRLNKCIEKKNLDALWTIQQKKDLKEEDIVVGIGNHLISKLAGRALTNKAKSQLKCPCGCSVKLEYGEKTYIGSEATWHGELDMFALGENSQDCVGVIATKNVGAGDALEDSSLGERSDHSQGDCTNLEVKRAVDASVKEQAISQTIVFGWTEYNRHEDLSPFIPSVLIDSEKFLFFIYNPETDIFLNCGDYIPFFTKKCPPDLPKDRFSGIFILWILLNHRLFFRKQMRGSGSPVKCGFKSQVELAPYERLQDFREHICIPRRVANFNLWGYRGVLKRKRSDSDDDD